MKVVTMALILGLAVVCETQFKLPSLTSLLTGFRPLFHSFPRFRPRLQQRPPTLVLAGQYIHSPHQTVRHPPSVFTPEAVRPIIRQQQTHQPTVISNPFIETVRPSPLPIPLRIVKHQHHESSGTIKHSQHLSGLHIYKPTKSSFRVVKSTKETTKPTRRHGFGPLRPESILSTGHHFQTSEKGIVTNFINHKARPNGKSIVKDQFTSNAQFEKGHKNVKSSSIPKSFSKVNNNNIFGMLPPPPPSILKSQLSLSQPSSSNFPKSLLRPSAMPVTLISPPPPPFSLPKSNALPPPPNLTKAPLEMSLFLLTSNTSSITSMPTPSPISNGLPVLNAGVLPLADESPTNFVAFPPFGNLKELQDDQRLQELFPPFPPNGNLFTEN